VYGCAGAACQHPFSADKYVNTVAIKASAEKDDPVVKVLTGGENSSNSGSEWKSDGLCPFCE
jgi:hypothetical protein